MKRTLIFLAALSLSAPALATDNLWDRLWRNADQRGERLLQQGDAASAAKAYSDPRRKAYAELRAGNYAEAARDLAPFDDAEAHYNRGYALAHSGELQAALDAYDAALKLDPQNADARKNRGLVEQALKQRKPPPQGQANQSMSQEKPEKDKQDGQPSAKNSESGKDKSNSDTASSPKSSGAGEKTPQTPSSASNASNASGQSRPDGHAVPPAPTFAGAKPAAPAQPGKDSTSQVPQPGKPDGKDHAAQPMTTGKLNTQPPSEQQLAQEQWLRNIPDDPGGLLRQKFLIEHLLQQQQKKAP